jgi:uncharacterized protein YfkK (UPF0435 family)
MTIDKKILSVDFDDDDKNYEAFSEYLEDDTRRKKNLTAYEIQKIADNLIKEIEIKKRNKAIKSDKLIPYILKHCNEKYNKEELKSYSFEDVQDIYKEIKTQRRSTITKIFQFIFN